MLAVNFLLDVMSVIRVAMTGAGDSPGPSVTRRVRALRVLLQKAATGSACGRTARRGQLIEGAETGIAGALPMKDWMVALVAFLFFAALLTVGVVFIAVNILRAHAAGRRDRKRRLEQSITKPSVPLPPLRPRSPVVMVAQRVAFALLMFFPILVVGAAAVLAVMHLATQNPG
jgi:hypothetical protein